MLKPHLLPLAALACVLLASVGTHAARPGIVNEHQHIQPDQQSEHAAAGAAALANPFHCIGNKNEEDCDAYENECTWCNSTTVGTGCYPLKIAKILPAKYFNCDYDPNDKASSETSDEEHAAVATELQKKHKKSDDEDKDDDIAPTDCFSQKKKDCKKADACEWCVSDTGMGSCFAGDVAQYIPFCKTSLKSALSESSASSSDSSDEDEDEDVSDSSASSDSSDEDEDEDEDSYDEDEDEDEDESGSSDSSDEDEDDEGKKHKVDCVSKNTSAACDEEKSCNWCSTSGFGTGCYPKKVSDYLPESVFKCDKPSDACVKQGTKKECISEDGCSWCTTGGLGTGCYPEKVADRLPKRFFTCEDGDNDDEDDSSSSSESSGSEGSSSSESSGSEGISSSESSSSEGSGSEGSSSSESSGSESSSSEGSSSSESSGSEGSSSSESSGSEGSSSSESSGSEGSSSSESSGSEEESKKPSFIDCMNKDTALECDASDRCSWCKSTGLGTGCYPRKVSKILPHKVFECDKEPLKDEEEEHEQKLGDAKCEKKSENECVAPSCVWCTSAAVGSACYSPDEAARLPSAVFSCKTAPSFFMPIA